MFKRIALYLPILLVVALLLVGCDKVASPEATFKDYTISRVTFEGIEVAFNFTVNNPNPVALDVTDYSYKIFLNDKEFLADTRPGFSLPSAEKAEISIPVMIRFDKLFGTAVSILEKLAKGENTINFKVEGSFTAGALGLKVGVPLKAEGVIPIPKDLKL
jgi:LEA14-like dessication related protein